MQSNKTNFLNSQNLSTSQEVKRRRNHLKNTKDPVSEQWTESEMKGVIMDHALIQGKDPFPIGGWYISVEQHWSSGFM